MTRSMKPSGIEWIGDIPEGWEIKSIKNILQERKETNNPIKTKEILSLTNDRGVIPYSEKGDVGNKSKDDISGYKIAYVNDIVLNSMNVVIGSVGISKYFGAVSPVYYMLYTRNNNDCIRYFNYIFQTKEFQKKLIGYGNGIMEIRMRIQMSKLNTIALPYPSEIEQQAIADYLDRKSELIDSATEKQKTVIDKLKLYKQAVITEAVTKGLDPTVTMKPSGIEWIGDIPEGWITQRGKNVLYLLKRPFYDEDEVITCFRDGEVTLRSKRREEGFTFADKEIGYQGIKKGDLVIHGMDGFAGAIGISDSDGKGSPVLNICKEKYDNDLKYLMYYLRMMSTQNVFIALATGIRERSCDLRWNKIADLFFPIPPLPEQQAIAEYLDQKCSQIDNIIEQKQKLIEKFSSYKKSLIYEFVTGKREVMAA